MPFLRHILRLLDWHNNHGLTQSTLVYQTQDAAGAAATPRPSLVVSHFSYVQSRLAIGVTSYTVRILRQAQLITRARKLVPDVNELPLH